MPQVQIVYYNREWQQTVFPHKLKKISVATLAILSCTTRMRSVTAFERGMHGYRSGEAHSVCPGRIHSFPKLRSMCTRAWQLACTQYQFALLCLVCVSICAGCCALGVLVWHVRQRACASGPCAGMSSCTTTLSHLSPIWFRCCCAAI